MGKVNKNPNGDIAPIVDLVDPAVEKSTGNLRKSAGRNLNMIRIADKNHGGMNQAGRKMQHQFWRLAR